MQNNLRRINPEVGKLFLQIFNSSDINCGLWTEYHRKRSNSEGMNICSKYTILLGAGDPPASHNTRFRKIERVLKFEVMMTHINQAKKAYNLSRNFFKVLSLLSINIIMLTHKITKITPIMSLAKVVVSWDAFSPCLAHALSNEKEEIMGLLLGHVDQNNIAIIRRSLVLQRKVKKKDRVEISYESLALASTIAEQLSDADSSEGMQKQPLRILGWYHSHPHITCFPSHVDVKTQGSYQQLESAFVGLIFSVFDKGNLEICAFQALQIDSVFERIEVPLVLEHTGRQTHLQTLSTKTSLDSLLALQASLLNEDLCAFTDLQQNELRAGDCAVLSRRCLAFQSALQRKIDLQVVPLQMVS